MKNVLFLFISIGLFYSCKKSTGEHLIPSSHSSHLQQYVESSDLNLNYNVVQKYEGEGWTEYRCRLVSGNWLTENEVTNPEWWHWVTVIVPEEVMETEALMVIGGGSAEDSLPVVADQVLVNAAIKTKSTVAYISNIPFQPVDFLGDDKGGTYEDELIAYGWAKFLEGGAKDEDTKWLARLPMTRAVAKGMDVVENITREAGHPVDKFVVTGASKRGWTTWTTAITDDRVIAIAPVVIDLLNLVPSFYHHWRALGQWSPAITEYINEGIMEWMGSEEFDRLLELVEPYSFIDSLQIPKFMVNATGDEFFLTDSWKFYWNDLKGDKYLQYVPNGNHGLTGSYNLESIIAFYQAVITGAHIPGIDWQIDGNVITVTLEQGYNYSLKKWEAFNPAGRDFRVPVIDRTWESTDIPLNEDGKYSIEITTPEEGFRAGLIEITVNPEADYPFTFTSGTVVTPDKYPYPPFQPEMPKGTRKVDSQ